MNKQDNVPQVKSVDPLHTKVKGYLLGLKHGQEQTSKRIAKLEAENASLNGCVLELEESNSILLEERDKYREALEQIYHVDWNYPANSSSEKAYYLINNIVKQALNSKEEQS